MTGVTLPVSDLAKEGEKKKSNLPLFSLSVQLLLFSIASQSFSLLLKTSRCSLNFNMHQLRLCESWELFPISFQSVCSDWMETPGFHFFPWHFVSNILFFCGIRPQKKPIYILLYMCNFYFPGRSYFQPVSLVFHCKSTCRQNSEWIQTSTNAKLKILLNLWKLFFKFVVGLAVTLKDSQTYKLLIDWDFHQKVAKAREKSFFGSDCRWCNGRRYIFLVHFEPFSINWPWFKVHAIMSIPLWSRCSTFWTRLPAG